MASWASLLSFVAWSTCVYGRSAHIKTSLCASVWNGETQMKMEWLHVRDQKSYSLGSITSNLGGWRSKGRNVYFYPCWWKSYSPFVFHFLLSQAGLFYVYCKTHLTNKQRYKVLRVGGWERTLSFPFQLRERAELVVWGYLLSLTMSLTMPQGCPSLSDAAQLCWVSLHIPLHLNVFPVQFIPKAAL